MNHTTNYNLNQWEDGDRVTRADFNADNAKIDSAIKVAANAAATAQSTANSAKSNAATAQSTANSAASAAAAAQAASEAANRIVLLREQTTTAQMTDLTISLSDIATENYFALILLIEPPADGESVYFVYLPDGSGEDCYNENGTHFERVGMGNGSGVLIIRRRPGERRTYFKDLYYTSSGAFTSNGYYCYKPLNQIGSMVARVSNTTSIFPAGMRLRLYGVKY